MDETKATPLLFLCTRFRCRLLEARCVKFQTDQREACANCLQGAGIAARFGVKVTIQIRGRCEVPGCMNEAGRGRRICEGHRKQWKLNRRFTPLRTYKAKSTA